MLPQTRVFLSFIKWYICGHLRSLPQVCECITAVTHVHYAGGGNWVTKLGGRANTPYFVSPQRNHDIPGSSLAFGFQYELEISMTLHIVDCIDHVWNICKL